MIINFSIKNFGPFKEQQTLSFIADNSKHLENYYIINENGYRLLKMILIYGPNASGKTYLLKALEFLRQLAVEPLTDKSSELQFQPFLFDKETPERNSIFIIEFIQNKTRYLYEVEFNTRAIVQEKMFFYAPKKALLFRRHTNVEEKFSRIEFGKKIKIDENDLKALQANTLWNNTVLGGFMKTNVEIHRLNEVLGWFKDCLQPLILTKTDLVEKVTSDISNNKIKTPELVQILKKADLRISNIHVEENKEVNKEVILMIEKILAQFFESNVEEEYILPYKNVYFEHDVNNYRYKLPIQHESAGTSRFYGLAGILLQMLKNSIVVPVDELESSIHPDLFFYFILMFLVNSKHSQLIASTHNREFLMDRDLFRNDAIWFTEKDENGSVELFSLSDFDTKVIRKASSVFNAYKSGKLGAIPNLSDYYLDIT